MSSSADDVTRVVRFNESESIKMTRYVITNFQAEVLLGNGGADGSPIRPF